MNFKSDKVTDFFKIFDASKQYIRNMEGCTHLELLNDISSPTIFFTYSHWETENDLNNYRNSEFFEGVWGKTKILFATKAEAWSVKSL